VLSVIISSLGTTSVVVLEVVVPQPANITERAKRAQNNVVFFMIIGNKVVKVIVIGFFKLHKVFIPYTSIIAHMTKKVNTFYDYFKIYR
jgi:mRNA-degrading endonuclease HigB of HigAB toxin-antitoxin module